jgi:phosphatidylglycerophosphate synthase
VIERAILLWKPEHEPLRVIAGLPSLLRQLLSLQDAGVSEVFLVGAPRSGRPTDHRLWLDVQCTEDAPTDAPALLAPAGLVWHSALPSQLANINIADDEVNGFSQGDAWALAVGREQMEELLTHPAPESFAKALPDGLFLYRVDDPEASHALFESLRKPLDGIIARRLNRYVSLWVTEQIIHTSITPNQMTLIAALFGLLSVYFGCLASFVWAGVCIQLQSILDGCDGEIARLKYLRSRSGEWLDSICDDVLNFGVMFGVGWGLIASGSEWISYVLWPTVGAQILYNFTLYYALLHGPTKRGNPFLFHWWFQAKPSESYVATSSTQGSFVREISDFLQQASRRDFILFLYLAAALLGLIEIAFCWHAFCSCVAGVTSILQWLIAGPPRAAASVSGA